MKVVKEIIADIAHLKPVAVAGVLVPVLALAAKWIPGIDVSSAVLVPILVVTSTVAVYLQKIGL